MQEITEYRTARAASFKDLDLAVNENIQQGYQPFGNPYTTQTEGHLLACQAMVKYAAPQTPDT